MKIVFFDGYCNLCNGLVDWLMRRDTVGVLKFASLQGSTAKEIPQLASYIQNAVPETIVYLKDNQALAKSTAVLLLLVDLGGPWQFTKVFLAIPPFLRDMIYDFIAKRRYSIFGKSATCRLPTAAEAQRFLP